MIADVLSLLLLLGGLALIPVTVILLERYLHRVYPTQSWRKWFFIYAYALAGALGCRLATYLLIPVAWDLMPEMGVYGAELLGLLYGFCIGATLFMFLHSLVRKGLHRSPTAGP
jgi:hypothetical protein